MTSEEQDLENWRLAMMTDLESSDIELATRALLALAYDDSDRRRVEVVLLDCLSRDADFQIQALAVTCMGHLGRIHRAISVDVVHRLEGLLEDSALGGRAEDALDDIRAFVKMGNV